MKQSILGRSAEAYRRLLLRRTALCVAVVCLTAAVNFLLAAAFSEKTYTLFLLGNIISDIFCGFFLIAYLSFRVLPLRRRYRLFLTTGVCADGTVQAIGEQSVRRKKLDCLPVTLDDRVIFLPVDTVQLAQGASYRFRLVGGIITEAEQ